MSDILWTGNDSFSQPGGSFGLGKWGREGCLCGAGFFGGSGLSGCTSGLFSRGGFGAAAGFGGEADSTSSGASPQLGVWGQ